MDRERFRSLKKKYTEKKSCEEEIHRHASQEDSNLLPPLYHRKCVFFTTLCIREILSFETDKTTERNPIESPISSLLILENSYKFRRNTNSKFVDPYPTPSSDEEMSELVKENDEEKDTQRENNSNKNSHKKNRINS